MWSGSFSGCSLQQKRTKEKGTLVGPSLKCIVSLKKTDRDATKAYFKLIFKRHNIILKSGPNHPDLRDIFNVWWWSLLIQDEERSSCIVSGSLHWHGCEVKAYSDVALKQRGSWNLNQYLHMIYSNLTHGSMHLGTRDNPTSVHTLLSSDCFK